MVVIDSCNVSNDSLNIIINTKNSKYNFSLENNKISRGKRAVKVSDTVYNRLFSIAESCINDEKVFNSLNSVFLKGKR